MAAGCRHRPNKVRCEIQAISRMTVAQSVRNSAKGTPARRASGHSEVWQFLLTKMTVYADPPPGARLLQTNILV
jgi:hypothetical protein